MNVEGLHCLIVRGRFAAGRAIAPPATRERKREIEREKEKKSIECGDFFSLMPGCMISSRWHHNDASLVHQANQGEVVRSKQDK